MTTLDRRAECGQSRCSPCVIYFLFSRPSRTPWYWLHIRTPSALQSLAFLRRSIHNTLVASVLYCRAHVYSTTCRLLWVCDDPSLVPDPPFAHLWAMVRRAVEGCKRILDESLGRGAKELGERAGAGEGEDGCAAAGSAYGAVRGSVTQKPAIMRICDAAHFQGPGWLRRAVCDRFWGFSWRKSPPLRGYATRRISRYWRFGDMEAAYRHRVVDFKTAWMMVDSRLAPREGRWAWRMRGGLGAVGNGRWDRGRAGRAKGHGTMGAGYRGRLCLVLRPRSSRTIRYRYRSRYRFRGEGVGTSACLLLCHYAHRAHPASLRYAATSRARLQRGANRKQWRAELCEAGGTISWNARSGLA